MKKHTILTSILITLVLILALTGCEPPAGTAAHTHTWGNPTVTTPATVLTAGVLTSTCSCGKTKTEPIPALYSVPSDVDGNPLTAAPADNTVYFGFYPRSVAPAEFTIDTATAPSVTMGKFTYYKASDGNYYTRVQENPCSFTLNNSYTDTSAISNGYRWFKAEPIAWKLINTNYDIDGESGTETACLLLAAEAIDGDINFCDTASNRYLGDDPISSSDYRYSNIRAFLNGYQALNSSGTMTDTYVNGNNNFLKTAFIESSRALLETVTIDGNAALQDKVFLLSKTEAEGLTETACMRCAHDYMRATNVFAFGFDAGIFWLLRTPSTPSMMYCIDFNGTIENSASSALTNESLYTGIVPAIAIKF